MAILDGSLDGAARFELMPAISEPAFPGEGLDISESLRQSAIAFPQLQFAHSGRIDQHAPARQDEKTP